LALRCILLGIVAVNIYYQSLRTGSRAFLWICLIDQVPFVVALQRTWKAPQSSRLGSCLGRQHRADRIRSPPPQRLQPRSGILGKHRIALEYSRSRTCGLEWARLPGLRPHPNLPISIFPALAAYTVISQPFSSDCERSVLDRVES
jgi:hypothetical protein